MNRYKRSHPKGYTLIVSMGLLSVVAMTAAASYQRSQVGRVYVGAMRVQKSIELRADAAAAECMARVQGSRDLQNKMLSMCTPNTTGEPAGLPTDAQMGTAAATALSDQNTDPACIGGAQKFVLFPMKEGPSGVTADEGGYRLAQCVAYRRRVGASRFFVLKAYGFYGADTSDYAAIRSVIEVVFDGDFRTITQDKIRSAADSQDFW